MNRLPVSAMVLNSTGSGLWRNRILTQAEMVLS